MNLSEALSPETIRIPLAAGEKEDVLRELVSLLPASAEPENREKIYRCVWEREQQMSTGIGQGIAIPHGKCDVVSETQITFGLTESPIDFESLDGEPVQIFFLLVSPPEMTGPHIRTLARISRLLSSDGVRSELAGAKSADEVLALFRREEPELED